MFRMEGGGIDTDLTERILAGALEVHRNLGPGLLESVYRNCLAEQLAIEGLSAQREVPIPVSYNVTRLQLGIRRLIR